MADPSLICIQKTPMYMSICGLVLKTWPMFTKFIMTYKKTC